MLSGARAGSVEGCTGRLSRVHLAWRTVSYGRSSRSRQTVLAESNTVDAEAATRPRGQQGVY